MKLIIEIELDNAAFGFGCTHEEVGRILREMLRNHRIRRSMVEKVLIKDINGNTCGYAEVVED